MQIKLIKLYEYIINIIKITKYYLKLKIEIFKNIYFLIKNLYIVNINSKLMRLFNFDLLHRINIS